MARLPQGTALVAEIAHLGRGIAKLGVVILKRRTGRGTATPRARGHDGGRVQEANQPKEWGKVWAKCISKVR